jgi:hypothetical protein
MRVCSYILVGLLFVGAGLNQASALSLDALDEGGSLESGALTFSDFDVVVTGAVSADLSLYDVSAIDDGFAITGPISAADGEQGDLFIEFTVSVSSGAISGVGLSFNGAAAGAGSAASVVETFEGISDLELFVFATGGGGLDLIDEADLSRPSRWCPSLRPPCCSAWAWWVSPSCAVVRSSPEASLTSQSLPRRLG